MFYYKLFHGKLPSIWNQILILFDANIRLVTNFQSKAKIFNCLYVRDIEVNHCGNVNYGVKVEIFLRTVSSIDLISLKIQIVGGNQFKNPGFQSPLGKVKFFCPIFFSYSP